MVVIPSRMNLFLVHQTGPGLILTGIIEVRVPISGIQMWGFDSDDLYKFKV